MYASAGKRFSTTRFSTKFHWSDHPAGIYTCPSCAAKTVLALKDFERRRGESPDQVPAEYSDLVDSLPEHWRGLSNSYLGFRCSGCAARVLLFYSTSYRRNSGHFYWLEWVVEDAT